MDPLLPLRPLTDRQRSTLKTLSLEAEANPESNANRWLHENLCPEVVLAMLEEQERADAALVVANDAVAEQSRIVADLTQRHYSAVALLNILGREAELLDVSKPTYSLELTQSVRDLLLKARV
jgi:hypothetical protein